MLSNWIRERKRTEPNRTELKRFGSVRVEPIRTRTDILKNESNRTELEPDDLGSVRVYGSSEF